MLPITMSLRFDSSLKTLGYAFLIQIIDDGLVAISILQSINQIWHLSTAPRLCRCRLVILHELGDKLETSFHLSQHCPSLGQCPVTISSNSLNNAVITFVRVPLKFPTTPQNILLLLPLLLHLPSTLEHNS